MPQYFYADCAITDIEPIAGSKAITSVSAKIDGRQVKRMVIPAEMQLCFAGLRGDVKNRVWFAALNILGKRILMVRGVENAAGELFVQNETFAWKFYDIVIRSAFGGFLAWFAANVIGLIPAMIYSRNAVAALYEPTLQIGIWSGLAMSAWTALFIYNLSQMKTWQAGDVSRYSTEVKPAFGSGLAAKMSQTAEVEKAAK
ncbi:MULTISPECIES: hypothetical protein [unclassified Pseudomonas]|uniref:hypothetical protein n=1 Tax=unclassified Pseudomonas TaxID=196821 RepID=UPI00249CE567|nr:MULTISPECIES: hypothetical protein [unclassified Pseudomonas]MDI3247707.1 hypothetical protein [Pseudomonas sp. AL10]MDI3263681.1 hypothetical protein [Pseudomonas sp. AL15]